VGGSGAISINFVTRSGDEQVCTASTYVSISAIPKLNSN
jgi:hypothetical protein